MTPPPRPWAAPVATLAATHDLDPAFPPDVDAEARAWVQHPGLDDPALEDLTRLPFATIDEPTSRDLDQALAIEADGDGHVVWYAIADASFYVRPRMPLFEEALRRGASTYLPGLVVPMLPTSLSEGLVSLNPDVDRRAVVFRMALDGAGRVTSTTMRRARVHSRCKTSYDAVQGWFDGGPAPSVDPTVVASLRALEVVGQRRIARADPTSLVSLRRREVAVRLADADAGRFVAFADLRNDVERYNEQVSVLANTEGARLLRDAHGPDVHPIYRVHEPPAPDALAALARASSALAALHGLSDPSFTWDPVSTPIGGWLASLPSAGRAGRVARAVHRQAMLASRRSVFQAAPGGHAGVGVPVYGRFTAPMREIVGVFLHKELCEQQGWTAPWPRALDEALRDRVIEASHRARERQAAVDRDANRLVLDALFAEDHAKGVARGGVVMGLGRDRVHVELDDPPIDVKAYLAHLDDADHADVPAVIDPDGWAVRRGDRVVLRVGDAVRVRVRGLDRGRDRWRLGVERAEQTA